MAVQDPREISRQKGLGANYVGNTRSGEKKTSVQSKKKEKGAKEDKILRYPYRMLDSNTDYLKIQIASYEAPGLNFGGKGIDEIVKYDPGEKDDKGNITRKTSLELSADSFQLRTGTESNAANLKNPKHTIILPIPQQLSDTAAISWNDSSLNPAEAFGVATTGAIMRAGDPAEAINIAKSAVDALIGKGGLAIKDEQIRSAITAALAGQAIGALGGNVSGNQLVSRATGQVFNPNLELLFEGVNLRSFPFSFEFFPRNAKEADQVKRIIRVFKKSMSARKNTNNAAQSGIFISAPDVFQVTYMKGRNPHPFLNKFLPMALTNINLTYTGSNTYSTFYDGTPTHMKMELTFKELNPIYFEDYENLQNSGDNSVGY
jgi:hypothetical protein